MKNIVNGNIPNSKDIVIQTLETLDFASQLLIGLSPLK